MKSKQSIFLRCCYGYAISGMSVLIIGAVLPAIMRETGLSYTLAGGLLSMMAIGNLFASLCFPMFVLRWGKRNSISILAAMVPLCIFGLTLLPSVEIMYLLMFGAGVARGSITIINNTTVNILSNNSGRHINLLHCSFAIGAFLAPFLTALLTNLGFGWRTMLYLIAGLCITSTISYATIDYQGDQFHPEIISSITSNTSPVFLKNPLFYCIGFLLFFYLGTENCINGWFVTYLQNTGVMSETYATTMVSITWLVIMIGRLVCANLSKKHSTSTLIFVNALGSCVCFFILIMSMHLITITIALLGMGFFLAGIYPTCIANAGGYTKGSTMGMSLLTAISAMGGIITPQLVGGAADYVGIVGAIGLLGVNAVVVVVLSLINLRGVHKVNCVP